MNRLLIRDKVFANISDQVWDRVLRPIYYPALDDPRGVVTRDRNMEIGFNILNVNIAIACHHDATKNLK